MSVPGIFKLGRVSIMLQIWHLDFMHFFATSIGWCSEDFCLDKHLFKVGRLSICAESCAAEQVFISQHVAVAFPFFHNSFVSGDNSLMFVAFVLIVLFVVFWSLYSNCFVITLIG